MLYWHWTIICLREIELKFVARQHLQEYIKAVSSKGLGIEACGIGFLDTSTERGMRGIGRSCRTGINKPHCNCRWMIRLMSEWSLDEMKRTENEKFSLHFAIPARKLLVHSCPQKVKIRNWGSRKLSSSGFSNCLEMEVLAKSWVSPTSMSRPSKLLQVFCKYIESTKLNFSY
jgi:hypothetical protein